MGVLTADMKRLVEEQRLGYVATVCQDGTPNLSPKGTTAVWDDDHMTEDEVRDRWERHFQSIRGRGTSVPTGE